MPALAPSESSRFHLFGRALQELATSEAKHLGSFIAAFLQACGPLVAFELHESCMSML